MIDARRLETILFCLKSISLSLVLLTFTSKTDDLNQLTKYDTTVYLLYSRIEWEQVQFIRWDNAALFGGELEQLLV